MMEFGSHTFRFADQIAFAQLSGDINPIHVDARIAARSPFGSVLVHGMHAVAKLLDAYATSVAPASPAPFGTIKVQFLKPIFLDETLRFVLAEQTARRTSLRLRAGTSDLVRITLDHRSASPDQPRVPLPLDSTNLVLPAPKRRSPTDTDVAGMFPLGADPGQLRALFPGATAWLGERVCAGLALVSTVVGMEWPGLNSLLSEMALTIGPTDADPAALTFRVASVDTRYALTGIDIVGPDFNAEVSAFFRPDPVRQPSMTELSGRIERGAFEGHSVWVIGGSRGLGEIAAKLVAIGGGRPVITYRSQADEAQAVAAEIRRAGAECDILALDVTDTARMVQAFSQAPAPTMLLYFATPKIFHRRTATFSRALFDDFVTVYVDGFEACVAAGLDRANGELSVLYPSSVALDTPMPDLLEYAMAKISGEVLCRVLEAGDKRLSIRVSRLPRLLTDQTNTIVQVETSDPAEVLLPLLLALKDRPVSALS